LDWTDIDERRGLIVVTKALTIGMESRKRERRRKLVDGK
jgi:hypothetical protein